MPVHKFGVRRHFTEYYEIEQETGSYIVISHPSSRSYIVQGIYPYLGCLRPIRRLRLLTGHSATLTRHLPALVAASGLAHCLSSLAPRALTLSVSGLSAPPISPSRPFRLHLIYLTDIERTNPFDLDGQILDTRHSFCISLIFLFSPSIQFPFPSLFRFSTLLPPSLLDPTSYILSPLSSLLRTTQQNARPPPLHSRSFFEGNQKPKPALFRVDTASNY